MTILLHGWKVNRYLAANSVRKLHIGSGRNILNGWLNTDIQLKYILFGACYLDATRKMAFQDSTFDYVFSEHCIEHLSRENAIKMLQEIHRVLKNGGKIRIATPDLKVLVNLYLQRRKSKTQLQYRDFIINRYFPEIKNGKEAHVLNNAFYNWGHRFIYDKETISDLLTITGFSDLHFVKPGESQDKNLKNLEGHGKIVGAKINEFETLVVEGTKK